MPFPPSGQTFSVTLTASPGSHLERGQKPSFSRFILTPAAMQHWWVDEPKLVSMSYQLTCPFPPKLQLWNGFRRAQENEGNETILKLGLRDSLSIIPHTVSSKVWQFCSKTGRVWESADRLSKGVRSVWRPTASQLSRSDLAWRESITFSDSSTDGLPNPILPSFSPQPPKSPQPRENLPLLSLHCILYCLWYFKYPVYIIKVSLFNFPIQW